MTKLFLKTICWQILFIASLTNYTKSFSLSQNQTHNAIQKETKSELEKCTFLENALLSNNKKPAFTQKLIKTILMITIPIATSILICKTIDHFIFIPFTFKKNDNILKNITKRHLDSSSPNYSSHKKHISNEYQNINRIIFITLSIVTYFVMKQLLKVKEKTNLKNLENFIKNWPKNKINTPEIFHNNFTNIHNQFLKNKKLNINELEAKKIIVSIILEMIEYKLSLNFF